MKIFSSLLAFVMMFACLSTAYADVALPPRNRNVQSDFLTADVEDNGKLTLKFEFPYECDYEYQFIQHRVIENWEKDGNTQRLKSEEIRRHEIFSDSGHYNAVVEKVFNLSTEFGPDKVFIDNGRNFFLLNVKVSNIKEQTRFGIKRRRDNQEFTKTILIEYSYWQKKFYGVYILDGDQTRR